LLILSGSLTNGGDILTAEAMGADFAYMGTRFIATVEAKADPEHKQMILDAEAYNIVYTSAISGVPGNFIDKSLEKNGFDVDKMRKEGPGVGKLKSLTGETKSWNRIWSAGQGVSNIHDVPTVHDLIDRFKKDYAAAQQAIISKINKSKKPPAPPKP